MKEEKFLDIKNRFDGSLGRVNLFFDQESNMYKDDDTILDSKTNSQKPTFTDYTAADVADDVEEVVVVNDDDDKDEFEEITGLSVTSNVFFIIIKLNKMIPIIN